MRGTEQERERGRWREPQRENENEEGELREKPEHSKATVGTTGKNKLVGDGKTK